MSTGRRAFRVIDTGVRDGRRQIAFDQAMIDLHREGKVRDSVRFLRFQPCALVGRHQSIGKELKLDYCRENGIGIVRRITGGGAIYLDPGQVGWELVISRKRVPLPTLQDYTREICEAVASGLSQAFSIDARFRPRNDIEVDGRKLCGTGGFFDGDTLFYQGTVLVDADPERVLACLNVPEEKLRKRNLDNASNRLVTLKHLMSGVAPEIESIHEAILRGLSEQFGIDFSFELPSDDEEKLAAKIHDDETGTDEFVYSIDETPVQADCGAATLSGPGGSITALVRLEGKEQAQRIQTVLLTGDFFVAPPRILLDLEANLRGVPLDNISGAIDEFFAATRPELLSLAPGDFKTVVHAALRTLRP